MEIKDLNRAEQSLLMYLETAAVDHAGRYDPRYLNDEDREIVKRWQAAGLLECGRVASESLSGSTLCLWVRLPEATLRAAHELRLARARRTWENRRWLTTAETQLPLEI